MNTRLLPLLPALCLFAATLPARPLDVVGNDEADQSAYSDGWSSGKSGGSGYGKWTLQTAVQPNANSNAGFYIAGPEKTDLKGAALHGKAFGMYANGVGFETAAAFRAFDQPLKVWQSFSFLLEHGDIVKKFEQDDPAGGSLGLTLRSGNVNAAAADYNKQARFEFGYYKTANAYVIYDGDGSKQLDLPLARGGLAVTFTLVAVDIYNLEITTLADRKTIRLNGRKLGGTANSPVASFCLFDRNGEANDVYFNGFQTLQAGQ